MNVYVICGNCRAKREVKIQKTAIGEVVDWLDNEPNPSIARIVSARKRIDNNWGWSCVCGNDDLMTEQEREYISDYAQPKPKEINRIIKNLLPQKPKFIMEAVK